MSAARETTTLTVRRRMSARQQARRERILGAASALAAAGGYEAVLMKDVAARARVSLGTLYRYFGSKDHLLAETLLAWGSELGRRLRESPPRALSASDRVASVFRRMARGVEQEPQLGVALTRALLSADPSAFANREGLEAMMRDWIEQALGDADVPDREGVIAVLRHVCFSSMIMLVNGQRSPQEVGEELARATRLLLGQVRR
jgi:TetR/AcrR family transcriptional regulator, cholesterol catabolism regulator